MSHWRPLLVACVLLAVWQAIVWVTDVPPYILPGPARVALALVDRHELIIRHAGITLAEILLGIVVGTTVGASAAASMAFWRGLAPWLQPVLVARIRMVAAAMAADAESELERAQGRAQVLCPVPHPGSSPPRCWR